MSTSAKQAIGDIRLHIVSRVVGPIKACIDFAATHCKADPQLGVKLQAVKVAADEVVTYIDSRVKNG